MPANKWFPILNWKSLPAFGQIHRLTPEQFVEMYFADHMQIQHTAACLFSGLKGEFPSNNARIIGSPGIGKTTFLHYIKYQVKVQKKDNPNLRAYLAIVDSDATLKGGEVDLSTVDELLFEKTADYFDYIPEVRRNELVREILANPTTGKREKTRLLWLFFEHNRTLFTQRLFLVLDGVDTLADNQILPIALRLHNSVPHAFVRLWLTIRETRYRALGDSIRQPIDTLFQEPHVFPVVELDGIIAARIKSVEAKKGTGKNPFSPELCGFLSKFYNGDLRRALAMCGRLLQEIPPKGIDAATDQSFIYKYLERQSISVLFRIEEIPNLYDVSQGAFRAFPLEKEVLMLLSAHPRVDQLFMKVLTGELRTKLTATEARIKDSFRLSQSAVEAALVYLETRGLIERHGKVSISITPKGWELQKIAETQYYMDELCRPATEAREKVPGSYWKIAAISSNYQSLVLEQLIAGDDESLGERQ